MTKSDPATAGVGVERGVGVDVCVGGTLVGVAVAVSVLVGVSVGTGVTVSVGVAEGEEVGVSDGIGEGVRVITATTDAAGVTELIDGVDGPDRRTLQANCTLNDVPAMASITIRNMSIMVPTILSRNVTEVPLSACSQSPPL
jgi:hypothetical protein